MNETEIERKLDYVVHICKENYKLCKALLDCIANHGVDLLPDSTPNYFNGGDTLSRAEAMALVTRATTPVMTLTAVDGFDSAVTGTDYDQYINYAAQQNDNAYINTSDKSLTSDNFKGAMSRAEFIYLVMNNVYTTEAVQAFDTTNTALKDCTNAGNLSAELKISDSDRCNGYTLSHSLKNVDKGVTEELCLTHLAWSLLQMRSRSMDIN